jgi:hypothetical protein
MRSSWWSRRREAGRERLLPARVLLYAALLPLILRFRKLPDLPAWVEPAGALPPPPAPETVMALVERIDALLVAGRPAVRTGCMIRGLTLYRFLRRAGAEVSLHFGVGTIRGEFAAHCWMVYQGEPLEETVDPRPIFTETWRIGSEPSPPGPLSLPLAPSLTGRGGEERGFS